MDVTLYHVTWHRNLEGVADHGLRPGGARCIGTCGHDARCRGRLFLTSADGVSFWHGRAEDFASDGYDDPVAEGVVPVVLRVRLPSRMLAARDDAGTSDARADAFVLTGTVPPDRVAVWSGDGWVPVTRWEDVPSPSAGADGEGFLLSDASPFLPPGAALSPLLGSAPSGWRPPWA